MNLIGKIVIAAAVAAACWAALHFVPAIPLPLGLLIATIATAVLTSLTGSSASASQPASGSGNPAKAAQAPTGPREEGQVKWFNVSKGFGFITKDDGDEIFVHFRSIRGEGRRGLREGQRVSFVEAQTDKGPQAEDVEAL